MLWPLGKEVERLARKNSPPSDEGKLRRMRRSLDGVKPKQQGKRNKKYQFGFELSSGTGTRKERIDWAVDNRFGRGDVVAVRVYDAHTVILGKVAQ